ncbi:hypothetical protein B0H14DRAFT_2558070 [Mycena olivaceomarginata]|nr:hypothetical protein B0H14DRAFT_2558070 [Mycena olivaceomarginata]
MSHQTGPLHGVMAPQLTSNNTNLYGEGALLGDLFQVVPAPVPHAFQQRLSEEKTHTLRDVLPAFEAMILRWEKQQARHPETTHIVQNGIVKSYFIQSLLDAVYTSE